MKPICFVGSLILGLVVTNFADADLTASPALQSGTEISNWKPNKPEVVSGMDIPDGFRGSGKECYVYSDLTILVSPHKNTADSYDFTVMKTQKSGRKEESCARDPKRMVFELDDQDFTTFMGLWRHFLFLDSGTGPERGVDIYDILKALVDAEIYSGNYSEPCSLKNGTFIFWENNKDPKLKDCKPKFGLQVGYEAEVTLDLKTLKKTRTGQERCADKE